MTRRSKVKARNTAALFAAAGLAGAAALVKATTSRVERLSPPAGRFVEVDGVRLHYIDQGEGPPLVLLHGLGSMIEDFRLSGLVAQAAQRYRVIAFDRPGYGHSTRPRNARWGPVAQAHLIRKALHALNVDRPIVLGHSLGSLVASALALEFPAAARGLVLASGLYFPSLRLDTPMLAPAAIPVLGTLMRRTLSPLVGRALWPIWLKLIFAPDRVPAYFSRFPAWMTLRPETLRAVAEESVYTLPATLRLAPRLPSLTLPIALVAGAGDRYVSAGRHSGRLKTLLPSAKLFLSQDSGHMVHHSDLPLVLQAVDLVARESTQASVAQIP
jgi:pimeloyl-ACP methyl ester carboxylesterase